MVETTEDWVVRLHCSTTLRRGGPVGSASPATQDAQVIIARQVEWGLHPSCLASRLGRFFIQTMGGMGRVGTGEYPMLAVLETVWSNPSLISQC
jgi:hypothetical protein